MGTEVFSKDYVILLKEDIPKGRDDLIDTSKRLEEVAEHCLNTYDKSLEQTINYTAQALGSVAYKINLLATNFLEVLDQQNLKLNTLQTKVNHLNMQVQIHQEKTARLSIGKYTLPRDPNAMRPTKNIEPIVELSNRYKRREIDFSILDHVGHGMKEPHIGGASGAYSNASRRSSTSGSETHSSSNYGYGNSAASIGPRAGSDLINRTARLQTIGRASGLTLNSQVSLPGADRAGSIYRTPANMPHQIVTPAVQPPPSAMIASPPAVGSNFQYQSQSLGNRGHGNQQQQYQTPGVLISPQHTGVAQPPPPPSAVTQVGNQYGYPAPHPMAHIPPPPPPPTVVCAQPQAPPEPANPMIRYSSLPPPPMEYQQLKQQHQQQTPGYTQTSGPSDLPPPPSNMDQYARGHQSGDHAYSAQQQHQQRYSSDASVNIAHLQPTPSDVTRTKNPADPAWAPDVYICKVNTLYEYQQNKDDELSFGEHELIYVVKKNNDGWWEGIMSNSTGLFPGNYVQMIS